MDHALAGWLFVSATGLLLLGFPVAFTLLGTSLAFGLAGFGLDFFNLLPLRIWGVMSNFTLTAVPLFIFMGMAMERSGIATRLIESMGLLFGRVRGGMAVAVVLVGALLGASTGIVGATVVTMGLLALPAMLRCGYAHPLATGTIAASGTLGQIIPPSIVLILLGDIIGVPVGDLFIGALVPGFMMVGLYIAYILVYARLYPERAPLVSGLSGGDDACAAPGAVPGVRQLLAAFGPPLLLIVAVLGTIFAGVASPTEAAGVGAVGALGLAAAHGRLSRRMLGEVMESTTRLTSMIFIILVGATAFGLVFRGLGGDHLVRDFIAALPFDKWGVLAVIMALVFVMGFFLDFIEITFIQVPVVAPLLIEAGFDPVWLALIFAVNLQTSFLTPPFGFSLFYLKGVCPPGVSTGAIYKGIIPFVLMQVLVLGLCAAFPQLLLWLPAAMR
ncbi:TRAP transporter large permease subunit [Desulfocurvus sp.]|jgi:tripartite ATP-independent transporter DctM subunit|uniref:TRAP transporter large permease n=1 Tax=Desulfocurvus sp. TaxID=2871698 RepID=UPI0025C4FDD2|nr:TRAP transporter large permease subunit [Desulfocurvus sp.]MCK9239871.1 TRAP transporter large permease subunit [Desulfocurvus sp.]